MAWEQFLELGLIGLPLIGAVVVARLGPRAGAAVRWVSVAVALACLGMASALAVSFVALQRSPRLFAPEFTLQWELMPLGNTAVQFFVGVDGLNIWLIVLTAVLILPCVLVSWTHVTERVNEFYAWLLALQTCMFGVFLAFDIVLFYIFFELSLIPLFFLIGIWGGSERRHAARKFFVYTLTGSVLTLLGVMAVVIACQKTTGVLTFAIPHLVEIVQAQLHSGENGSYWQNIQILVFVLMMAGFAIKVPLVPLHTWLPLAHVEAPTAGSVDLAGVLLKIGAYGFLRLCIPLAPDASLSFGLPLVTGLAAIGIVYGALCAYSQMDVKRLVAYSSVSHLGLCMIGMFSLTTAGLTGSLMQMINHGLSTGALFLLIGVIYERYHTRKLTDYSGMAKKLPYFGFFLVFISLSSVGLPGLNGFVGEALCLVGIMEQEVNFAHQSPILTAVAASGMILGAWYLMTMLRRLLFGQVKEPEHHGPPIEDLKPREWVMVAPIALLCLLLGIYPQPVLDSARPDLETVSQIADNARKRAAKTPPAPVVVQAAKH